MRKQSILDDLYGKAFVNKVRKQNKFQNQIESDLQSKFKLCDGDCTNCISCLYVDIAHYIAKNYKKR